MPVKIEDLDKLLELVEAGDSENLRILINDVELADRGTLVNSPLQGGANALCMACRSGNEVMVRLLIASGASVDVRGVVELLTHQGIELIEQYPINAAVSSTNFNENILDLVIEQLKAGNSKIPTQLDSRGCSPLYYATTILDKDHRYNCLKKLLDSGIDYTTGRDPAAVVLCAGIKEEYRDIRDIKLLLEECAPLILSPLADIGNCLYVAAAHGYQEAAEAIVAKARSMDNMLVARGATACVLQALINNDNGQYNDLIKLAGYYGYNDFEQWVRAAGLPAPEFYRGEIPESDAEEGLVIAEAEAEAEVADAAAGGSPAKRRKVDSEPETDYANNDEEHYESPHALDHELDLAGKDVANASEDGLL